MCEGVFCFAIRVCLAEVNGEDCWNCGMNGGATWAGLVAYWGDAEDSWNADGAGDGVFVPG